ncbi:MAG: hypothetical protein KDA89_01995 [Planctomycetaceae bacterium]|nr:hypothetical protein [Planctomycetaceae bacterium]
MSALRRNLRRYVFAETRIRSSFRHRPQSAVLPVLILATACLVRPTVAGPASAAAANGEGIRLSSAIAEKQTSDIEFHLDVTGTMTTPGTDGSRQFPVTSSAVMKFLQQRFPAPPGGPFALKAARIFRAAGTTTKVADTETSVTLEEPYSQMQIFGSADGFVIVSPRYAVPRRQLDLLQMPCDPLSVIGMLPGSEPSVGDKWNTDAWVMSAMTGVEVATEQSAACELKSADAATAVVAFSGQIKGAIRGSAAEISVTGEFSVDRNTGLIRQLKATQTEKRTPGPVSPGMDVTAVIQWTQQPAEPDSDFPATLPEELPPAGRQLLALQTPLRLQFMHSREWFLFHETPTVLMMRQLRGGNLISQCNISSGVTVPAGEHTPDEEFRADVTESVAERKGRVTAEDTARDDDQWRIRHVQAVGDADGREIIWDYYLCSAGSGEQFSLVFSHFREDDEAFADEADRLLSTLQLAARRPNLPR